MKIVTLVSGLILAAVRSQGQEVTPPVEPPQSEARSDWQNKFWLSGQLNVVGQIYPSFPAAYSGPLSLPSDGRGKPTWVATVYTGYAPFKNTEVLFDLEAAKGAGVSGSLGLGGLQNLDAVTDPHATVAPYVARLMIREIIPLSKHMVDAERSPLGLAASVPDRRLEFRLGKVSLTDFFDLNGVGSDSHLQFLNYAIDNNAAYDIAANSRGYTYAALAELYQPLWALRFAEAFEPKDMTGQHIDWNLARSSSENLEFELHPTIKEKQPFTIRALGFLNHTLAGDYPAAVAGYRSGVDAAPDLIAHIGRGQSGGFGLNGETVMPAGFRLFGRFGWNPGKKELFQFAEADRTIALGADLDGHFWKRKHDHVGIATAFNGLAQAHRTYLELGGQSYLLGDGGLHYGDEKIVEGYYNVPLGHGLFGAFDVQRIWNPGYNQARGPVIVFGLRLHAEADLHFN